MRHMRFVRPVCIAVLGAIALLSIRFIVFDAEAQQPRPRSMIAHLDSGEYAAIVLAATTDKPVVVEIAGGIEGYKGRVVVPSNDSLVLPFQPEWRQKARFTIISPADAAWGSTVYGWGATGQGPRSVSSE